MAKAILLSIRPNWVRLILNKKKIYEIRKSFPKDYVGWVYIYCCKQRKNEIGFHINYEKVDGKVVARFWCDNVDKLDIEFHKEPLYDENTCYQAIKRICLEQLEDSYFDEDWCDRETLYTNEDYVNEKQESQNDFLKATCLSAKQLQNYFCEQNIGYAIHITKLEIFDKPKELSEFSCPHYNAKYDNWNELPFECCFNCPHSYSESNMDGERTYWCHRLESGKHCLKPLTKAPQSWCYVKVD